jgi:antitoxin VapB
LTTRTARIFTNGGSQAVRLPAEFRFEDATEVFIRRDAVTGDVVLSAKAPHTPWERFFSVRDQATVVEDPLQGRPQNEPLKPPRLFDTD